MKRSNRNFYEREEILELPDEFRYGNSYSAINTNLFNLETYNNLPLQELDYKFLNEFEKNEERFKVIFSNFGKKKLAKRMFILSIVLVLILLVSYLVTNNLYSIVHLAITDLNESELKLAQSVTEFIIDQIQIVCQIGIIISLFISFLGFAITRPFMSVKNGKRYCLILDDIGFYKIDLDFRGNCENNLSELYFVGYLSSILDYDLEGCVKSVSYFSSYSKTMSDRKYYVLDLPNDTISFSNEYDLEFCRKDFTNKDYKMLVEYLDSTEDSQ